MTLVRSSEASSEAGDEVFMQDERLHESLTPPVDIVTWFWCECRRIERACARSRGKR
jgi:hypothetical protein